MKRKRKSAFINTFSWLSLGLTLAGCGTVHTPHIYGPNEVPPAILNAPRPFTDVETLPANQPYPNINLMPYKPHDFSTPAAVTVSKEQLEQERREADRMKEDVAPPAADQ